MENTAGQWIEPQEGTRWWFDAGAPSLDFAWTGRVHGEHHETLHSPDDLARWLAERFPRLDLQVGERELSDALMLRSAIAALMLASLGHMPRAASDVDVVNLVAATPDVAPALDGGSRQAGAGSVRPMQALSSLARDAVRVFGSADVDGLRECSADDCGFVYLDTSRSRNRRWCSMQRCGNRAKVRAHRARSAISR